ncbi:MAG: helix-turn-helix domain-containing protein [Candidatus Thermoplasmatota archaeon]|nr:helix-turn-helix domain-containing protein [Candidatus Thermoplasmatota archaeon]
MREKILNLIDNGYTVGEISDNIDLSRPTIDEIIKSLVREGYLVDYKCESCSSCPFSCNNPDSNGINAFMLTEKGKDWIKEK